MILCLTEIKLLPVGSIGIDTFIIQSKTPLLFHSFPKGRGAGGVPLHPRQEKKIQRRYQMKVSPGPKSNHPLSRVNNGPIGPFQNTKPVGLLETHRKSENPKSDFSKGTYHLF